MEKTHESRPGKRSFRSLAKKIIISVAATMALLSLYVLWFVNGRPNPTVDYVALLNQKNRPADYSEKDNAWPHYRKAIELFVEPDPPDGFSRILGSMTGGLSKRSKADQADIIDFVEKNDAAWREFIEGSLKPHCYFEYIVLDKSDQGRAIQNVPTFRIDLKHLSQLRYLFMLGLWQSRVQVERDNVQPALNDCLAIVNAGSHLSRNKLLAEQLAGWWAIRSGHREILRITSRRELSAIELKDLQQKLANISTDASPTIDMEHERIQFLDTVQHTFTRGGIGGGHLLPKFLPHLVRASSVVITMRELETEPTFRRKALYATVAMVHARRDKTIARYDEMCDQIDQIVGMTPYERRAANISFDINRPHIFNYVVHFNSFIKESRYFLPEVLMPAVDRMAEVVHQDRGLNIATMTVLALQRWRLEMSEYPANLEQLVEAGYLDELPIDPFSNKPFVYEKVDGDFKLYSIGHNFTDDGGTVAYEGKDQPARWGTREEGDAVFWPIPRQGKSE